MKVLLQESRFVIIILLSVMIIGSVGLANAEPGKKSNLISETKIELNHVKNTAKIGQTIKISGKVSLIDGNPAGLTVHIKDHDFFDFDDYLTSATVDSKGKFSATWIVKDTDSSDRQYSSLLLGLLDPSFLLLSDANNLVNDIEANTVELYAEVYTSDGKINTCDQNDGLTSWDYCRNNTIKLNEHKWKNTESDSDSFWDLISWFIF